jgi:prepilin signal peptidase PulO-like enzyme (type II secretory pathway)
MDVFIGACCFALGAVCASFAGVLAARTGTGQSPFTGRSYCDACGKPLAPSSLVPIFSYVYTRGRASCCGARISYSSPISEALLGALFVLAYLKLGLSVALAAVFVSYTLLLALALYDLAHTILPPSLLLSFVVSAAAARVLLSDGLFSFGVTLVVAFGIALVLALIHLFSKGRAMGFADAPFAFGLALLVGRAALAGFVYSFWVGAVIGIIVLLRRPPGTRMGVEVPFAPFLAAGFLLAYFLPWNLFALIAA